MFPSLMLLITTRLAALALSIKERTFLRRNWSHSKKAKTPFLIDLQLEKITVHDLGQWTQWYLRRWNKDLPKNPDLSRKRSHMWHAYNEWDVKLMRKSGVPKLILNHRERIQLNNRTTRPVRTLTSDICPMERYAIIAVLLAELGRPAAILNSKVGHKKKRYGQITNLEKYYKDQRGNEQQVKTGGY